MADNQGIVRTWILLIYPPGSGPVPSTRQATVRKFKSEIEWKRAVLNVPENARLHLDVEYNPPQER